MSDEASHEERREAERTARRDARGKPSDTRAQDLSLADPIDDRSLNYYLKIVHVSGRERSDLAPGHPRACSVA